MAGLTTTGLEKKTEAESLAEIKSDLWANVSDALNLSSSSPLGQIVGIFNERIAELWDLAEAVHNGRRADSATGTAQTALALITGTDRNEATKTEVAVTVNIDDGFSQAAGTMVAHISGDPTARFVNKATVSNSSGVTANVAATFEAETAGALEVLAGELVEIAEPLAGWNTVTNAGDGTTGLDDETDEELRLRREAELQQAGSSTADAIRSDVLADLDDNVTHCRVLVNDTDATDANGLPPHSIEVIANGIDTGATESTRLATLIQAEKAAGIEAYGSSSETITDAQGNDHSIGYTWATKRNVWLEIDVVIDADEFPADGDDLIAAAIVALETDYEPGDDVIPWRLGACLDGIAGIVDVDAIRLGFAVSPVGTATLAIALREIADLDTARILVTHV